MRGSHTSHFSQESNHADVFIHTQPSLSLKKVDQFANQLQYIYNFTMAYKNLVNIFCKTVNSADNGLVEDVKRASAKALRVLEAQGKSLVEIFEIAEDADTEEELTSSFDNVNEVMMVFMADVKVRNRFVLIKQCLEELGAPARFGGFLGRASSLREAIEEWKTEIASEVSKKQRIRAREQRLNNEFDKELKKRLFPKSRTEALSLNHRAMEERDNNDFEDELTSKSFITPEDRSFKRPFEMISPLVTMDGNLGHPQKLEKMINKKRRQENDRASRDDRSKREKSLRGRRHKKTNKSLCYDYQVDKCIRGENCRYAHMKSD